MPNLAFIAVIVFVISLLLVSIVGRKSLIKSSKEFGVMSAIRNVALLSSAIAVIVVLFLKYVIR